MVTNAKILLVSVLNLEPMIEKPILYDRELLELRVSVLNLEPMIEKHLVIGVPDVDGDSFSAQP